ncbi:MAG: CPBP family intramembrane glutamic endopeptidase [Acidimicrobiales bacterium]
MASTTGGSEGGESSPRTALPEVTRVPRPTHPPPPLAPPPSGPVTEEPAGFDVPRTTRQGGNWMLLAGAGFVVGQVLSAALLVAVATATGHLHDVSRLATRTVPPAWVVVSGLVGLWIGFVGAAVVASRTSGTGNVARDMGVRFEPWDFVIGPAVGVAGQLMLLPLVYLPLEHVIPHLSTRLSQPAVHLTGGFPGADLVVIAVLTVAVVPVVEELLFRGLFLRGALRLFRRAGPAVGPALAVVSTGVVFGLAHLELLEFIGLAVFGMLLSFMAYKAGRLGSCILAHATFNLIAILAVAGVAGVH